MSALIHFVRGTVLCNEGHRAKFGKGTITLTPHYTGGHEEGDGIFTVWIAPEFLHAEVDIVIPYRRLDRHFPLWLTLWNEKGAIMVFPKIVRHPEEGYLMTEEFNDGGGHYVIAAGE